MPTQTNFPQTYPSDALEFGFLNDLSDFSLVLGGPIFQLLRKSHLTGDSLELLHRRLLTITAIAWFPLLLLSLIGPSSASLGRFSFFHDIEVHVRLLIALPVLVAAEIVVHSYLRPVVRAFVERRIIRMEDLDKFRDAISSAVRLRNSIPLELGLIALVYTVGLWLWQDRVAIANATWYATPSNHWNLTPAGFWYVFVSIPIFQFILLRWYMRLVIWFRFLWHVSKMQLNLTAAHPDRCAGLAFLGKSSYAFGPILFAQGALLAGLIATRVINRGESLLPFKFEIIGFVLFFVTAIFAPLLMFTPRMAKARRKGLYEYGRLSQQYVETFEQKWILGNHPTSEQLIGTPDIQSLADMGNSYAVVREMFAVPFRVDDIVRLTVATAAPLAPLLLTVFSPEELLMRVMRVVF